MPTFSYKAKKGPLKMVEGLLEAENLTVAINKLSHMGYSPVALDEYKEDQKGKGFSLWKPRVKKNDLGLMTRQLSDLLESGIPLLRALREVQKQTENKKLADVLYEILMDIEGGKSFSHAMKLYPHIFSSLYVSLVHAGEISGSLGVALGRLADFTEQEEEIRAKIRTAMVYPLFIGLVGAGTVVFLLTFVVPKLTEMFSDMGHDLPFLTRILSKGSQMMATHLWAIPLVFISSLFLYRFFKSSPKFKEMTELFLFRLPLWGDLSKKVAIARFAKTLSTLLQSGVPILEALKVVANVLDHPLFRHQVLEASRSVKEGKSLAESLKTLPDFPPLICHMIAVGEEGNVLEKSLDKVASRYDKETDRSIKLVTSLIEPIMILLIGSIIGVIVTALLLPIFQIPAFVK